MKISTCIVAIYFWACVSGNGKVYISNITIWIEQKLGHSETEVRNEQFNADLQIYRELKTLFLGIKLNHVTKKKPVNVFTLRPKSFCRDFLSYRKLPILKDLFEFLEKHGNLTKGCPWKKGVHYLINKLPMVLIPTNPGVNHVFEFKFTLHETEGDNPFGKVNIYGNYTNNGSSKFKKNPKNG